MVPVWSDMPLDGFHVNVLCDSPAAPCCRKFTVTDVDLIFQKVIAMLLPAINCKRLSKHSADLQPAFRPRPRARGR